MKKPAGRSWSATSIVNYADTAGLPIVAEPDFPFVSRAWHSAQTGTVGGGQTIAFKISTRAFQARVAVFFPAACRSGL